MMPRAQAMRTHSKNRPQLAWARRLSMRRATLGKHEETDGAHIVRALFTPNSAAKAQSSNLGAGPEETMVQRLIPSGVLVAIAGGTVAVALSCCPSFAFTLSAPSLDQSVAKADVQQVYYYGHHYYHPYYHHAYHHPYHYDHYDKK
jgi:hypothetical protein